MVEHIPTTVTLPVLIKQRTEQIMNKLRGSTSKDNPKRPEDVLTGKEMRDFHQMQAILEKQGLKVLENGTCYVE